MSTTPPKQYQTTMTQQAESRELFRFYDKKKKSTAEVQRERKVSKLKKAVKRMPSISATSGQSRNDELMLDQAMRQIQAEKEFASSTKSIRHLFLIVGPR